MKLTVKDKEFLERLRALLSEEDLHIDLHVSPVKHFVLRRNYGSRIESHFRMTRQGVRWRFQRLMDMYVSAYETILFIESSFGTDLRRMAMEVARERAELVRRARREEWDAPTAPEQSRRNPSPLGTGR